MFCTCATGSCSISVLVWPIYRKSRQSRDGPEAALSGSMFCACSVFPAFFSLQYSSNMATGCDLRSLDPFGVPLGVHMRNLKLRLAQHPQLTFSEVSSRTSAFYYRFLTLFPLFYFHNYIIYFNNYISYKRLPPPPPHHHHLSMTSAFYYRFLALVICPFYFHIVSTYIQVVQYFYFAKSTFENFQLQKNDFFTPAPRRGRGYTILPLSVLPSVQDIFRRIFLSNLMAEI